MEEVKRAFSVVRTLQEDRMKRMRTYVDQLVVEREELRKHIRRLEDETLALQAQLARQAVKDTMRGMEGM